MSDQHDNNSYWKANLKLMSILLLIWFFVSYVCGILFVEELNAYKFAGFKLGFWIAQQGSMYIYLLLILIYVIKMNALDKKFNVEE